MYKKEFHQSTLFHLAVVLIPFLSFLNVNVQELDGVVFRSIVIIFFFTIVLIYFSSKIISFILKKISYENAQFILAIGFYAFFFLFTFFKDLVHPINPVHKGNISFFLISLTFFLVLMLFFYKKNEKIKKFIIIYLCLNFLINAVTILINGIKFLDHETSNKKILFDQKEILDIKNKSKKNIYYVVLDGALPFKIFSNEFNYSNYDKYLSELNSLGYIFVSGTKSSYQQTKYTFASIFSLDYYINENNYKTVNTNNLYPLILSKGKAGGLPLIKTLEKIGYKFKWIGTHGKNCELYNTNFCIDLPSESKFKDNESKMKLLSYYVLYTFLDRSPLIPIYSRVNHFFNKQKKIFKVENIHYENDGIQIFLDKIKKYDLNETPHFFLIHSGLPHQPYIYNSNCTINKNTKKSWLDYKNNYMCAIKRTKQLASYINKNDPNSIVIIQSDHSITHDTYKPIKKEIFSRYDIFNLIKINQNCEKFVSKDIDQINASRLALYCAVGQKPKLLEKKSYFVDFKIGNASIGGSFLLKKIETFEDEMNIK